MLNWLKEQIEWFKSFLSEPMNGSGKIEKGSTRRIAILGVTYTFVYTYIKTSFETKAMPDIPDMWVLLILVVLGVPGVMDYFKGKTNIATRVEDRKDEVESKK
jgi:hypothetical protein